MKASKSIFLSIMSITLLLCVTINANATPITFNFDLPDWDTVQPGSNYGSNAIVNVTLDNGNTSIVNQTYNNSSIMQVDVTSGSYFNSWYATDVLYAAPNLNVSYISTDATGIPILDLTIDEDTRILFNNGGGMWQFGTSDGAGTGYTNTWLEDAPGFNGFYAYHSSVDGFLVTGTVVPEPISSTLFLVGGATLGFRRFRRGTK